VSKDRGKLSEERACGLEIGATVFADLQARAVRHRRLGRRPDPCYGPLPIR